MPKILNFMSVFHDALGVKWPSDSICDKEESVCATALTENILRQVDRFKSQLEIAK